MTIASSPVTAPELVQFLVARIDEDEDALRRLGRAQARSTVSTTTGMFSLERQRSECQAKRTVIGHAQQLVALRDLPNEKAVRDSAMRMLRAMTDPYRDHYAYRREWAPTN